MFAATVSFLQYAVLNYLNEIGNKSFPRRLYEHLLDETARTTYVEKHWDFSAVFSKLVFQRSLSHSKLKKNLSPILR